MDKNQQIIITLIVIAIAIGAAYAIFTAAPTATAPGGGVGSGDEQSGSFGNPTAGAVYRIPASLEYANGVYTVSGTIEKPTPCHTLSSEVSAGASRATVHFTLSPGGGACAQVITPEDFSITFNGEPGMTVYATVNGQEAAFTTSGN